MYTRNTSVNMCVRYIHVYIYKRRHIDRIHSDIFMYIHIRRDTLIVYIVIHTRTHTHTPVASEGSQPSIYVLGFRV